MWDHIRRLHTDNGTTVFLTTHYLDEADELCDRILVMDKGRIIAEGTPSSLKARVSGDSVTVGVAHQGISTALMIVRDITGSYEASASPGQVHFRVPNAHAVLPEMLRAMDAAAVPTTSLMVTRPTLDDVFFHLTGRTLREAEDMRIIGNT
jgi:ABC-2 type transport system ATP-binding protein